MSVTIADCLRLPALRDAQVVAGRSGLNRIVTSVSVLEYADAQALSQSEAIYMGNELVISALTSIKDDPEAQCIVIRKLAESGEIGLLLYYVGVFVQSLDERVIALADELEFPIISVSEGRMALRYSEALSEIYELLFIDNSRRESLVSGQA